MDTKKYNYLVLFLLWSIAILYILAIDLKGVWTDEGMRFILLSGGKTWQQFNQSGSFGSSSDVLNAVGPAAYQPLFYLVDNAVIRIARSHSDLLLRLVNVLWLVFSLQGLLRLFRGYNELTRLSAVIIFALNGFMIMHVMQIREYPMYVAFLIWSSCVLFELLDKAEQPSFGKWWPKLLGYGALVALLFYSHPYSIFALAAQVIMVLTKKEYRWQRVRLITISYVAAALLALPWLIVVLRHPTAKAGVGSWDSRQPTLSLLLSSLGYGFRGVVTYGAWSGQPLMQVFLIMIVIGIPAAWVVTRWRNEKSDQRAVYAFLTVLFFGCFQVAYFFLREPLSVWGRYFIGYYYGYTVLATCAFSVLLRTLTATNYKWLKTIPLGVFLLICASGLTQYRMYRESPFMDTAITAECNWRDTSRAMARYVRPEETIVYYHPLLAWTIGIENPFNPNELSYSDIDRGQFAHKPVLWVLDTGVVPDSTQRALAQLRLSNYRITRTADLGCRCQLFRMELPDDANSLTTAVSGLAEAPPASSVIVDATSLRDGTVILDKDVFGVGLPVIRSSKLPSWAEFDVEIPVAQRYDLRVRCASEAARPVSVLLNEIKLTDTFCALPTGGYMASSQQWQTSGPYEFPKGRVRLRLESPLPFPCISSIAFVPDEHGK
jgi:hypothetical protein